MSPLCFASHEILRPLEETEQTKILFHRVTAVEPYIHCDEAGPRAISARLARTFL
jgi:hypothetical protein